MVLVRGVVVFSCQSSLLMLSFYVCSVAKEPDLKEWTSRAKLCDKLHDPVCSRNFFIVE